MNGNETKTFYVPSGLTALILVAHPYHAYNNPGMYFTVGGYSNNSPITAVLNSSAITITKSTENTYSVTSTASAFVTIIY